jgi:hypothetical protein
MALKDSRWRWFILAVVAVAAICAGVIGSLQPDTKVALADLRSIDDLRTRFNQDKGSPRLLLLLSPT